MQNTSVGIKNKMKLYIYIDINALYYIEMFDWSNFRKKAKFEGNMKWKWL